MSRACVRSGPGSAMACASIPEGPRVVPEESPQYNAPAMEKHRTKSARRPPASGAKKTISLPDATPLLLSPGLNATEVDSILKPYNIRATQEADRNIQAMAGEPHTRRQLATILPDFWPQRQKPPILIMRSIIGNDCFPEASIARQCWTICGRRLACLISSARFSATATRWPSRSSGIRC